MNKDSIIDDLLVQSGQQRLMGYKDMPGDAYCHNEETAAIQEQKAQVQDLLKSEKKRIDDIVRESERKSADKKLHKQRVEMLAEVVLYLEIQEAISMARQLSADSDYVVCAYIVAGEKKEKRILVGTPQEVQEEEIKRGSRVAVHTFAEFRAGRDRWTEDTISIGDEIDEEIPY